MNLLDARRRAPRVSLDGLCGVVANDDLHPASLSDLSTLGLRVERPFDPKTARPVVQLEIELPGIDEVIWASAAVTHAFLTPMGKTAEGQPRFWCKAGLRISDVTRAERSLLRDYIVETLRTRRHVDDRRDLVTADPRVAPPAPAKLPASAWSSLRAGSL